MPNEPYGNGNEETMVLPQSDQNQPDATTPLDNGGYYQQDQGYGQQNPGYYQQDLNYSQQAPGYGQQNQGYYQQNPNPGYGQQNQGYYPPNQGYNPPNQGYNPPNPGPQPFTAPVGQLKTNRALWKVIVFGVLTFSIYILVVMSALSTDINTIASRYDGKRTMHFCLLLFVVGPITLEIGTLVWYHKLCARIGNELKRRGIDYSFGAGTYWGWGFLGGLILIGPFVFTHKLMKAMNLLSGHYNVYG